MAFLNRIFGKKAATPNGATPPKTPPPKPAKSIHDHREPAIWLMRTDTATSLSRLGGLPSLPPHIEWPRQTVAGTPLHFLAQIDLSSLPRTPLDGGAHGPRLLREGFLFFFADIEEEMLWNEGDRGDEFAATRVLYAPKSGADRPPPTDLPDIGHAWGQPGGEYGRGKTVFDASAVRPYVIDTFAGAQLYFQGEASKAADLLTIESIERATGKSVPVLDPQQVNDKEARKLPAAVVEYKFKGKPTRREARFNRHQMVGAGTSVQGTADRAHEHGLVLLLQIDSDYGVDDGFVFCDMGMVQFWIKPEDLAAARFEKAWGTTEGG